MNRPRERETKSEREKTDGIEDEDDDDVRAVGWWGRTGERKFIELLFVVVDEQAPSEDRISDKGQRKSGMKNTRSNDFYRWKLEMSKEEEKSGKWRSFVVDHSRKRNWMKSWIEEVKASENSKNHRLKELRVIWIIACCHRTVLFLFPPCSSLFIMIIYHCRCKYHERNNTRDSSCTWRSPRASNQSRRSSRGKTIFSHLKSLHFADREVLFQADQGS